MLCIFLINFYGSIYVDEPDTMWMRVYETTGKDTLTSMIEVEDGNILLGGWRETEHDPYPIHSRRILKVNGDGEVIFDTCYFYYTDEWINRVKLTKEGNYMIAGDRNEDAFFQLMNKDGNDIFFKVYRKGVNSPVAISARTVEERDDGGYLVMGCRRVRDILAFFIKTDENGDSLSGKQMTNVIAPLDSDRTGDGNFILGGILFGDVAGSRYISIVKITQEGDLIWSRKYGGGSIDKVYSIKRTYDGNFLAAGYTDSYGAGGYDFYLLKITEEGDTLWSRTYGGSEDDMAFSVSVTPDNGFILAGVTTSFSSGDKDIYIVRGDSAGNVLWDKVIGGVGDDIGTAVVVASDSSYFIGGLSNSYSDDFDFLLIKLDKDIKGIGEDDKRSTGDITITEQDRDYIEFEVSYTGYADVSIYDIQSRKIDDVYSGYVEGNKRITYYWQNLSKGVYFIRAEIGENSITEKVVKIR